MNTSRSRLLSLARIAARPVSAAASLLIAGAAVAVATALRLLVEPLIGPGFPFVTYFLAVIASAAMGGMRAGLVAAVASLLLAWWLFLPVRQSFEITDSHDALALLVFAINATLSGGVTAVLRQALVRLGATDSRNQLLIDELNHRVKNTLATVQSLAAQTARGAATVPEFRAAFDGRLLALARSHDLLTDRAWRDADLGDVVRRTLAAHDPDGQRIDVDGPPVRLAPEAAVTVALAVHELCTNAVKHGALSTLEGRVEVRWRAADAATLEFVWRESGLDGVSPPQREGFGTRLLKAVGRELGGRAVIEHGAGGYVYRWRLPQSPRLRLGG